MPYLQGLLLASLHFPFIENNEARAEDGARVPQPEGLVHAHQLADVVLGGGSQGDHSAYAAVELKWEKGGWDDGNCFYSTTLCVIPSVVIFVKHFWQVPPAVGLVLWLLCSHIGRAAGLGQASRFSGCCRRPM